MRQTVRFTRMIDGTREDYALLEAYEEEYNRKLPDRLLQTLEGLKESFAGYRITRFEHSLQSATRAYRNGEDEDMVVAALLHDIGDELAPYTHGEMVAAILKPFVSEKVCWIIRYHPVFQLYYMPHKPEHERHARERFKDHPYYADAVSFCEHYDQNCFDPDYDSLPLDVFEPMVRRVFSRSPAF